MPVISATNDDSVKIFGEMATEATSPGPGAGMALELELDPDCATDMGLPTRLQTRDSGYAESSKNSLNHNYGEAATADPRTGRSYDEDTSTAFPPPRSTSMRRKSSAKSTSSSSSNSISTPSLSRSPSLDDEEASDVGISRTPTLPSTPASTSYALIPTDIPIEHVHTHVGEFYYPPSTVPISSPYTNQKQQKSGVLSSSSSLASSISSKFRLHKKKPKASPPIPIITAPVPTRVTGPAIAIQPPESDALPEPVYRPSIQRLALRHANSYLSRHPLALASASAPPSSAVVTIPASSKSSLSPQPTSVPSPESSQSRSRLGGIASRARKGLLTQEFFQASQPLVVSALNKDKAGGPQREGGLILPEPLGADEVDEDRLSLSWETRKHQRARAERAERLRIAKEAMARRAFEETMNRYRTPFMGF